MKQFYSFYLGLALILGLSITVQGQSDFYAVDNIQKVEVTFKQEKWRYLLDSLRYNGEELLDCSVTINGEHFERAGIRYRDGKAFTPGGRRNGLFISLGGKSYGGVQALDLSSGLSDPSMVREVLGYEIANKFMVAPQANYAKVYINNTYYGLFVNVEVVDATFAKNHNGTGELYRSVPNTLESEPDGCYKDIYGSLRQDKSASCLAHNYQATNANWDDLYKLTAALKSGQGIEEILDVDQALWMLAFNTTLLNLNSYTGKDSPNYYLIKNNKGQYVPVLGQLNLCFGSYKNTGVGSDLYTPQMVKLDPLLHAKNEKKSLIHALLNNEEYVKIYYAHIRSIRQEAIRRGQLKKRALELQKLIYNDFVIDQNRYYSTGDFSKSIDEKIGNRSRIPALAKTMDERSTYLKTSAALAVVPPKITTIDFEKREQFSTNKVTDFKIKVTTDKFTKEVYLLYRFEGESSFTRIELKDNGKMNDGAAGDNVYGATITPQGNKKLEYYIMASHPKAVSFSPANYFLEKHTISLAELN